MKPKVEEKPPQAGEKGEKGDSDLEMMNLDNEIYSLTHYADDEEELVAQMFATIKGSKLEAMMPPILKEIPLIDVQQLCLHELRGMSQRRILSIINGQEMSGSSSDENSDEERKPLKIQDENEDSNLGTKSMDEGDEKELAEIDGMTDANLTALDILELEMRAKLIKTMLEKQDGDDGDLDKALSNGFDPNIKIKEEPVTPESERMNAKSPDSSHSHRSHRKRHSRRSRSGSRSCSSSCSSRSRSSSYSRSGSRSRSRSDSSEGRKDGGSVSPESKKPTKKKITKKEFEARMRKAKMNRSYRKRKDSEDDSGEGSRRKGKSKKKSFSDSQKTSTENEAAGMQDAAEEEVPVSEEPEEGEDVEQGEEGEATEKEEGEIDSNEGTCCSRSSRSRSRSYNSGSYSSYSSRSRSYSRSPRRRKRKNKHKKKYRRSRSRNPSSVPKIPNWKPKQESSANENVDPGRIEEPPKVTLPSKEDRQSVSFSFSKKNAPIKSNPELNDDGLPAHNKAEETMQAQETELSPASPKDKEFPEEPSSANASQPVIVQKTKVKEQGSLTGTPDPKCKEDSSQPEALKGSEKAEPGEVVEDFYKGADQLSFSEEEEVCEDEADLEKFLHDDTPVEPIQIGENILRKPVKVVANKNEPPIVSWESRKKKDRMKGDLVIEGVGFLKKVLSGDQDAQDFPMEDSSEALKEQAEGEAEKVPQAESLPDTVEEESQDAAEPLHGLEAEDSQESNSMDIIGVIDPENREETFEEDFGVGGSSWSMRWLQSEKVQKVVSNSKMLSKVRKKIQAKGKGIVKEAPKTLPKLEAKPEPPKPEPKVAAGKSSNVIGSIEEYEKLFGIKVKAPTSLPQPKPAPKPPVSASSAAVSMFSDDEEDSEDDAIWSKIIKK